MKKLQIALLGIALTIGIFGAFANSDNAMPVNNSTDFEFDVFDAAGGPLLFTGTAAEVMFWSQNFYPNCTETSAYIQCTKVFYTQTNWEEPQLERFRD